MFPNFSKPHKTKSNNAVQLAIKVFDVAGGISATDVSCKGYVVQLVPPQQLSAHSDMHA